jgi:redox-sensitive bicupin YhaK (pirin superfamily)
LFDFKSELEFMKTSSVKSVKPLGFMWPVSDPFLFCAHHYDQYPAGNEAMEPVASLKGRNIGQDFTIKDGWRMYHGEKIPGFPVHPHRGFETVTIVKMGLVDHSDSHGQAGRYGDGDVQWMTAGAGIQHCEMFPLINMDQDNPTELFQVWINLPGSKKFVEPHFKMLWNEEIPIFKTTDENEKSTHIKVIAGFIDNVKSNSPAPDSWAADPENEVAIWTIKMEPSAKWVIPKTKKDINRHLYFHDGISIIVDGIEIAAYQAVELKSDMETSIQNGNSNSQLLILQGKPINEPIVSYGPFVMNTKAEIQQAMYDYQKTQFGGWPWSRKDQVHPRSKGRFAKFKDGTEDIR